MPTFEEDTLERIVPEALYEARYEILEFVFGTSPDPHQAVRGSDVISDSLDALVSRDLEALADALTLPGQSPAAGYQVVREAARQCTDLDPRYIDVI